MAKVDPGRTYVLAERERERIKRDIAERIRAAKSRAELATLYETYQAHWWQGATDLGNQLFPPTSV